MKYFGVKKLNRLPRPVRSLQFSMKYEYESLSGRLKPRTIKHFSWKAFPFKFDLKELISWKNEVDVSNFESFSFSAIIASSFPMSVSNISR